MQKFYAVSPAGNCLPAQAPRVSTGKYAALTFAGAALWRFLLLLLLLGSFTPAFAAPTTPDSDFTNNGDGTVTHKITGLTWQRCAVGQTWDGTTCTGTASTHTYEQALALSSNFAGHSDWRLPNIAELKTLVEREKYNPAINTTLFPDTPSDRFWSASVYANNPNEAWNLIFGSGNCGNDFKGNNYAVRLVRGGQSLDPSGEYTPASAFTDHGNGTVTHKTTTLMWQRCAVGQTWDGTTCSGTASTHTYEQALALKSTLAGYSDWRLPSVNELQTIVEYKYKNDSHAINTAIFPATPSDWFWSASVYANFPNDAWIVVFDSGYDGSDNESKFNAVRLVRGKQSLAPLILAPNTPPVASYTLTPEQGTAALTVALDASAATTSNGQITSYAWKTSDNQSANGQIATLNFTQAGVYDIALTITDTQGATASLSKKITVAPIPKLASASFTATNNTPEEALPILVNDTPVQQVFLQPDDVDWYEFYAKAGKSYSIEIPGNSLGAAINPSLQLFNVDGTAITAEIKQTALAKGLKITVIAPTTGLLRLRVANNLPFASSSDASDYSYQLRVYLTDAPQQGLVKGFVLNTCNSSGISKAEVTALLGSGVSDSTLTHKTGEYGLLLNPDSYQLKSTATSFLTAEQPVTVSQIVESQIGFNQAPEAGCQNYTPPALDPQVQKQQAVAVYDETNGLLIVRDVWSGDYVYYAELHNSGNYRFQLGRVIRLSGTIHAQPGEYGYTPMTANLPKVFALGKTWKVQLKNQGDWLFTVEKAE